MVIKTKSINKNSYYEMFSAFALFTHTSLFLQYKWNVPAFLTHSTVYTDMVLRLDRSQSLQTP